MIQKIANANTLEQLSELVQNEKLNQSHLTLVLAKMRELTKAPLTAGPVVPSCALVDSKGNYILKSYFGAVKASGDGRGLVPCENNDPAVCGRLGLIYGFGFEQRDKGLNIKPLTEFMRRGQPGSDGKRQLQTIDYSWAVGAWCLIADWKMGQTGPSVARTFWGFIGDAPSQFTSAPSYNVRVQPADALVEGQLRMMVETAISHVWGHNGDRQLFGNAESSMEIAKSVARIGAFGLSTERAGQGPRFVNSAGETVEAGTVNQAVSRRPVQSGTQAQGASSGSALRTAVAEARKAMAKARQAEVVEDDNNEAEVANG